MLNPDMPAQELRLHMGEMTAQEERAARAAIRWANVDLAEIRAILAEPVRQAVEAFPTPNEMNSIRLHRDQWKRLHELLGGAE